MSSAGTKARAIRLDDDLWEACLEKSARTGVAISEKVREGLAAWIDETDDATSVHPGSPHIAYIPGRGYVKAGITAAQCAICSPTKEQS